MEKLFYFWTKSKIIEKLFSFIVTYSYLILPLVFLIGNYWKLKEARILALYGITFFLLLFFFDRIPLEYLQIYNTLYTFLEYTFFTTLFYLNFESQRFKKLLVFLSIGFYIFQVVHFLTANNTRIDSIPIGVESILLFVYVILFFNQKMRSVDGVFIYNHFLFWVSVGLLIYLGGSFFINILANTLPSNQIDQYWHFSMIADTIKTLFFVSAMIVLLRNPKIQKKSKTIPYLDMI